jgi:prepilin-type N-terminal cleavage/methylation domain-containing protein
MRTSSRPLPRRGHHGVALLEVMVALTILAVGLIGTMRLQIMGITANGGAHSTTYAGQLATELAAALERLEFSDGLLSGASGASAPTPFGRLLGTSLTAAHVHTWSDANAASMLGVRLDSTLPVDPVDSSKPLYVRRWAVWDWDTGTANGQAAAKVISVSVIYTERGNPVQRELVVLTHKGNAGLISSFASAFR